MLCFRVVGISTRRHVEGSEQKQYVQKGELAEEMSGPYAAACSLTPDANTPLCAFCLPFRIVAQGAEERSVIKHYQRSQLCRNTARRWSMPWRASLQATVADLSPRRCRAPSPGRAVQLQGSLLASFAWDSSMGEAGDCASPARRLRGASPAGLMPDSASPARRLRGASPAGLRPDSGLVGADTAGTGTSSPRRLRSPSPASTVQPQLRGAALVQRQGADDASPRERIDPGLDALVHGGGRAAKIVAAFDASGPGSGRDGERRRVRASTSPGPRLSAHPAWAGPAEAMPPEAAAISFPSKRRALSPGTVMDQVIGNKHGRPSFEGNSRDSAGMPAHASPIAHNEIIQTELFGSPRRRKGNVHSSDGRTRGANAEVSSARNSIADATPRPQWCPGNDSSRASLRGSLRHTNGYGASVDLFGHSGQPQLKIEFPRQDGGLENAAEALKTETESSPIMFKAPDNPISLTGRPIHKPGEFSPRRRTDPIVPLAESESLSPYSPASRTRSPGRGQFSPEERGFMRDQSHKKQSLSVPGRADSVFHCNRRLKRNVESYPKDGAASKALQWNPTHEDNVGRRKSPSPPPRRQR
ncbi:unnamed protein product [Polarella glacialis]|uniref:Uncharacterized protein n=1 Tax=Polarella glacialis TaxID=89957 RepID=A0A813JSQ3_POLGL|nr:unnamed protein product [Polarella glacialis]